MDGLHVAKAKEESSSKQPAVALLACLEGLLGEDKGPLILEFEVAEGQ